MSRNTRANRTSKLASNPPIEQEFQEEQPPRAIRSSRRTTASGSRFVGVNAPSSLIRRFKAPFKIRSVSEGDRFKKLAKQGLSVPYAIYWDSLRKLGIKEVLEETLQMLEIETLTMVSHEHCEALTYEFFTTIAKSPTDENVITFRLDGKEREYSVMNLIQEFKLRDVGLRELPDNDFDENLVWNNASGKPSYDSHVAKLKEVRDIATIILLKWYGHTFYGRHEYNKVARTDLFLLRALSNPTKDAIQVNFGYLLMKLVQEHPTAQKRVGYGLLALFLARKDPDSNEDKYVILPPRMIDVDHLNIGAYVSKGKVAGKYKFDNWVSIHPGEPIPPRLQALPRQEVEPRRAKETVRRKDKQAAATSTEDQGVPEGVQWEQPAPNVSQGGSDFEAMQIRFMEDQRKMWERMEHRQKRFQERQRRHEEKLRDYLNAQGGPRYPSPTPSPEPPVFD